MADQIEFWLGEFEDYTSFALPYGNNRSGCGGFEWSRDQFRLGVGHSYVFQETCTSKMTGKKSLSVEFAEGNNNVNEITEKRRLFWEEHLQKVKSIAGHIGLLITLMLYTAIGALVSSIKKFISKS